MASPEMDERNPGSAALQRTRKYKQRHDKKRGKSIRKTRRREGHSAQHIATSNSEKRRMAINNILDYLLGDEDEYDFTIPQQTTAKGAEPDKRKSVQSSLEDSTATACTVAAYLSDDEETPQLTKITSLPPRKPIKRWRHKKHYQTIIRQKLQNDSTVAVEGLEAEMRRTTIGDSLNAILGSGDSDFPF